MTGPVPSALLDVEIVGTDPDVRIALVGELTHATVALFAAQVDVVPVPSRRPLVLDVGGLRFCDSIGLSALIGLRRRAALRGGDVVLSGVHGSLARTLAVTGTGALFGGDAADEAGAPVVRNGAGGPA